MVELSRTPRAKGGWTEEETKRLFEEAKIADSEGRSVKSVFDKISRLTGRKPNSIRNYYYLKLKENGIETKTAFIPFEEDEVYTLLRSMLKGQAEGKSVRGIALQMANGDKKTMLRYQNKYRSLIKTDPQIVKKTILELKDEGVCCKNPLKSIKHEKKDITALISELVENLTIAGIDPEELIDSLNDLARLAGERKRTE